MKYLLLLCSMVFSWTGLNAQTEPTMSVTISPVHLTLPVVEIMVENLTRKGSVAGILGLGKVNQSEVFELGMQYNYYFLGNFNNGLEIGVEALFANSDKANMSFGPQLGYKVIVGFGLTFHIQGGYGFSTPLPSAFFLNLNTGWSF